MSHNQFIDFSESPKSTQLLVRKTYSPLETPKQLLDTNIVQQSSFEACCELTPKKMSKVPPVFRRKG